MRKTCLLVHLITAVLLQLRSVDAQRPCAEQTLDNAIRNFIGRVYQSDVSRILGRSEIDTGTIDLFGSCVSRRRQYGLPDNEFGIDRAVVSFNIPGDYNSNSGDAGYTGRLDVQCWRGQWLLSRSYQEPYLREAEGVCAQCDTTAHVPCRPCLLSCESNEIPLDDCSDCGTMKTELHTFSKPAWKDHVVPTTASTKSPDPETQLDLVTELVGTTMVMSDPDGEQETTEPGIETIKPETKGYTTKVLPTASTSQENKITTKSMDMTENVTADATTVYGTGMLSPLYTGTFEVVETEGPTTEAVPTDNVVTTKGPTTPIDAKVVTTEAEVVTTEAEIVTTKADVVTTKAEVVTTEAEVVTTEAEVVTTDAEVVTTKAEVVTTDVEVVTTKADVVTTKAEIVTTKTETATTEGVATTTDTDTGSDVDETEDLGNDVDDTMNADPEFCVDPDKCYNGGESVCERNGGDFLYCICHSGFTGTYCEQERSVAKVDSDTRGQGGFWDWKLSKYIIGGLGALTVIGLIMLTCMVVKCVRSGKEDRRRTKEYNTVGLETFIPPAPVVPSMLTAAAMDRGSSDVMDERSEEEFPLHDSDTEPGDGPVHVHRRHHLYPDPEDDGLLHHAPSHRLGTSPDHYKVPTPNQHREYMNMNGKQNGTAPYMNGHHTDDPKNGPYMNGTANTYSHKLNDKSTDQYAHLNRSFSKNAQPQHQYLNLP